jgi:CheY-like chemotaxis protein
MKRVILAEDDPAMRRLVAETLSQDGYVVEPVNDGGRLLVEISRQIGANNERRELRPQIDLIISDIRMPVASGLQIVEALRAARCKTPVILMTAFGDDAARAQAERLNAKLFDKPFDLEELRTAARQMLDGR